MARIPENIVDKVIKGNDILQVVSNYVKLEKKGKNYFGLCPFHSEKTPSFSVSTEKQIFNCFSCGEGGNVAQFISKIDNLSFIDSIKKLASNINFNLDQYFNDTKSALETNYLKINQFVSDYYQFALLDTKDGKEALDYLHKRNMTDDLIKQFQIGLAPNGVDSLYQALKSNNYSELAMLELGHVVKYDRKFYDKFKNRIMFPITDEYGNTVGFSGRTYLPQTSNEPKYVNTQETPIFKKGQVLYNLYHAKKSIKQNKRVFLFEGFMDVIASYQSGLYESVASMGTSLTNDHIKLLKKYTNQVVICYDGDNAGIEATKKAITLLDKEQFKIFVVHLPDGLDPDDYVNQYGKEKYIEYLTQNQRSYKEYLYTAYYSNVNLNHIASVDEFKKKVFQLIINATPTERELFLTKLSNDIQVSTKTLQYDYSQYTQFLKRQDEPNHFDLVSHQRIISKIEKNRPSERKRLETQKLLIFYCLNNRKFVNNLNNNNKITFYEPLYRQLYFDINRFYNTYDDFNHDVFMNNYLKNDENYTNFYEDLFKQYQTYKGSFNEVHFEQCMSVMLNQVIADFVASLKEKLKTSKTLEEQVSISQQIVDSYKLVKVNQGK